MFVGVKNADWHVQFLEGHKKSSALFQICWEEPEKQKTRSCRAQEFGPKQSLEMRGGKRPLTGLSKIVSAAENATQVNAEETRSPNPQRRSGARTKDDGQSRNQSIRPICASVSRKRTSAYNRALAGQTLENQIWDIGSRISKA